MIIKKKLKYFTRPKQISPGLSGVSGDFRIVWSMGFSDKKLFGPTGCLSTFHSLVR